MFVEPPKDPWFILGEYMPPPYALLALAGYLERSIPTCEIEIVDCQAERLDWNGLEDRIESAKPDIVAPSSLSTANTYAVLRTAELAKRASPKATTVVGGQHFTALAEESLCQYPDIDVVVRGEGEETFVQLVKGIDSGSSLDDVKGISLRNRGDVLHTASRDLICDLDSLPYPAYHLVEKHMKTYYFALMAEKNTPFGIIEGSRGCQHNCSYCTQWRFWEQSHRYKSPGRIADEMENLHHKYGTRLFWLTDDNFDVSRRGERVSGEIMDRGISEDIAWFTQARCDDIVEGRDLLPDMRKAGCIWVLVGFDTPSPVTLEQLRRRNLDKARAKEAVDLLRENSIFSQGTFIIGERKDTRESITAIRDYADWLDPDIATFMALTPYPGTEIYETARRNGWIEDTNWSNYDMVHAIMPTEQLTRKQVQEELYECYRSFFGSWKRRYQGMLSPNLITRRIYQYLARQAILTGLRSLF